MLSVDFCINVNPEEKAIIFSKFKQDKFPIDCTAETTTFASEDLKNIVETKFIKEMKISSDNASVDLYCVVLSIENKDCVKISDILQENQRNKVLYTIIFSDGIADDALIESFDVEKTNGQYTLSIVYRQEVSL